MTLSMLNWVATLLGTSKAKAVTFSWSRLRIVKWNFHVLEELTLYVGARTGLVIGLGADIFEPDGGGILGLYWHLGQGVDLRLEGAYAHVGRGGAQVGSQFPF